MNIPASIHFLLGLLFAAASLNATAGDLAPDAKASPRGEYVLRHQAEIGQDGTDYRKFCTPFTANLNEFRHLDFETCDARLSPQYPQFSRPQWEEIPLDLDVAKKIIGSPPGMNWEHLLKITEAARAVGEVKLWRIRVDLLKDGNLDTLVRLDHYTDKTLPYCSYIESRQIIVDIPDPKAAKWYAHVPFYRNHLLGGDMIYDAETKRYYVLEWNRYGRAHGVDARYLGELTHINATRDIGATASVRVSRASDRGIHAVCWIDWVATGKRKSPAPR